MSLHDAPRVLVAGAGCTGALVAAFLRRSATQTLHLSVWEWARGPAGRMTSFWAHVGDDASEKCLADVGAQVISMQRSELLPPWLRSITIPAQDAGLACTDERIENWSHFFAPEGLPSLQRKSIDEAKPEELHYNRRVVELVLRSAGNGGKRWRASYTGEQGGRRPVGYEDFDVVVFAGTAADALNLKGIQAELSNPQLQFLRGVRYDHRLCAAFIFRPELAPALERLCEGKAERSYGEDGLGPISLVARQEVKGRSCASACSVVVHSTRKFAAKNLQAAKQQNCSPSDLGKQHLLEALSKELDMSHSLEKALLHSKIVHWRQCQVRGLPNREPKQQSCCVVGATLQLILAGDYLSQSNLAGSFEGCLESAASAAEAVCQMLFPNSDDSYERSADDLGSEAGNKVSSRWRITSHSNAVSYSEQKENVPSRRTRRWQQKA